MSPRDDLRLPRRSFLGVAALGLLGLTATGCGSDDDGSTSTAADGQARSTATTDASGGGRTAVVAIAMRDIAFSPREATVKVGQRVVWTNREAVQHDVRALKGATFQSKLFGEGGTYAFTPNETGTIEYDCSVHPGMTGSLKVVAA